MVSLVDIGPSKGTVELRGQAVEVNGLTAEHFVGILVSFPEVRKILAEREADLGALIAQAPLAIARMIAAGTGKADDNDTIEVARGLGVGEQYDVMVKIFDLTFPKGLQSFLDGIEGALKAVGVPGWEVATKLPAQSSSASEPVDQSGTAGTAPQPSSAHGQNS